MCNTRRDSQLNYKYELSATNTCLNALSWYAFVHCVFVHFFQVPLPAVSL